MWRMGSKQKVIAQALGIAQGTVSKVLKRNRETGVPTPRARPGRPRKTTEREDRSLSATCRNGRTKSANTLRAEWLRFTNTPVSRMLVNLRLIRAGYFARRPLKKPLLLQRHRQARMDWARNHLRWRPGHWKHVIFSDESRFLLYRIDGRIRVRRQQHEAYNEDCIVPRVQAGAVELPYGVLSTMVENVTFTSSMETWISTSTYRSWMKSYCHLLVRHLGIILCTRMTTPGLTELAQWSISWKLKGSNIWNGQQCLRI